jgi:hypothetical protein
VRRIQGNGQRHATAWNLRFAPDDGGGNLSHIHQ